MDKVVRLDDELWWLPMARSNAYLWRAGSSITVIDTGDPGEEAALLAAIREIGSPTAAVRAIVLTHWHADHAGSAAALAARTGAEVWAGVADAPVLRGESRGPDPVLTDAERPLMDKIQAEGPSVHAAPPCPVDRELRDGDLLDPQGRAVVVGVPGHTDGSIAVHLPGIRAVLTGDVVVRFEEYATLGPFNVDRVRAWRSLRRLAGLDVDVAGVGHGLPIAGGAAEALRCATDPLG